MTTLSPTPMAVRYKQFQEGEVYKDLVQMMEDHIDKVKKQFFDSGRLTAEQLAEKAEAYNEVAIRAQVLKEFRAWVSNRINQTIRSD